jgi:hypothetical protein
MIGAGLSRAGFMPRSVGRSWVVKYRRVDRVAATPLLPFPSPHLAGSHLDQHRACWHTSLQGNAPSDTTGVMVSKSRTLLLPSALLLADFFLVPLLLTSLHKPTFEHLDGLSHGSSAERHHSESTGYEPAARKGVECRLGGSIIKNTFRKKGRMPARGQSSSFLD